MLHGTGNNPQAPRRRPSTFAERAFFPAVSPKIAPFAVIWDHMHPSTNPGLFFSDFTLYKLLRFS